MNWISARPGSGAPASVWSGSASAAASETAPRIPAQLRDDPGAPVGAPRALRGPPVDRPDDEGDDEVPEEADRDHRGADGRRVADHLAGGPSGEPVDDHRQLQADQDEQRSRSAGK